MLLLVVLLAAVVDVVFALPLSPPPPLRCFRPDVFSSSSKFIVVVVVRCFCFFSSIIFVRLRRFDDEGGFDSFAFVVVVKVAFPLFSLVLPRINSSLLRKMSVSQLR